MPGTLRVSRQDRILDHHRRWDIVIDGETAGSVASGQCCELPVRCGDHTVRVGHRWLSSPVRRFSIHYANTVEFLCRPRPNPMIWIPYSVASLYRHDLFIVLEPVTNAMLVESSA
jgi:hypothetical protein